MLELITILVTGVGGVLFVGYCTPKIVVWGLLGTAMMWTMAHITPSFSPEDVLSTIWPHILDLLMIYPTAIGLAWDSQMTDAGILGGLAILLWAVILLPPYLVGIFFGLLTWPELILFRVFL